MGVPTRYDRRHSVKHFFLCSETFSLVLCTNRVNFESDCTKHPFRSRAFTGDHRSGYLGRLDDKYREEPPVTENKPVPQFTKTPLLTLLARVLRRKRMNNLSDKPQVKKTIGRFYVTGVYHRGQESGKNPSDRGEFKQFKSRMIVCCMTSFK